MLVRVFTLKFDPVVGGFDDDPLRDFIKDKEILSIRDHFFVKEEVPYLAVVVTYNLLRPEGEEPAPVRASGQEQRETWGLQKSGDRFWQTITTGKKARRCTGDAAGVGLLLPE